MKRSLKVRFLLLLVLLVLTFVVPATQTARQGYGAATAQTGTCSGDDCGCGVETQACIATCNGNLACVQQCRCEGLRCSKACCGARPIACP
jgi:hypothetical protein